MQRALSSTDDPTVETSGSIDVLEKLTSENPPQLFISNSSKGAIKKRGLRWSLSPGPSKESEAGSGGVTKLTLLTQGAGSSHPVQRPIPDNHSSGWLSVRSPALSTNLGPGCQVTHANCDLSLSIHIKVLRNDPLCPKSASNDQCLQNPEAWETYWKCPQILMLCIFEPIRYIIESTEGQIHKKQSTGRQYLKCIYVLNKFPMEVCGPYHFPKKSFTLLNMPLCEQYSH